jgi:hypothetical protein
MGLIMRIDGLPSGPLDAAAAFHAIHLPRIRHGIRAAPHANLVLVFAAAAAEHRAWRLAVIQHLARELAPVRVNGVAGSDAVGLDEATRFLDDSPGVTGQLLSVQSR